MKTHGKHVFLRLMSLTEHDARNLAGDQFVVHGTTSVSGQTFQISHLHISQHLYTFIVKMIIETGELKCRTVHIRMGQNDLVRIQFRGKVGKLHFIDQISNRNSVHTILLSGSSCHGTQ